MSVTNGPQFPNVPVGRPTKIGTILVAGDQLQFSMSATSVMHAVGAVLFQSVANGTITTFTADIRMSLDGGTTFTAQTVGGGFTSGSNTAALNFQTGPLMVVGLPGAGGQMSFQFVAVTFVLGTATKADIWAILS